MRTMPMIILRYCGCYSRCWSLRRSSTLAVRLLFLLLCSFSGTMNTAGGWRCQGRCTWWRDENSFKHQCSKGAGCAFRGAVAVAAPPSHGPVLLPRFVGRRASGCAQGGRQGAEETSQQGETQAPPGTKHGPAVAVTNVLGEAVHVAGVAGQLKVDSCHTRAQGDDAARSCVSTKDRWGVKTAPISHQICRTGVTLLQDIDLLAQPVRSGH